MDLEGSGRRRGRTGGAGRTGSSGLLILHGQGSQLVDHRATIFFESGPSGRNLLVPRERHVQHLVEVSHFVTKFHVREDVEARISAR